jgi:hypothetical protein
MLRSCSSCFHALKIAGQEHPDPHRHTQGVKQWIAAAVDTQVNKLSHTQFHHHVGKLPPSLDSKDRMNGSHGCGVLYAVAGQKVQVESMRFPCPLVTIGIARCRVRHNQSRQCLKLPLS